MSAAGSKPPFKRLGRSLPRGQISQLVVQSRAGADRRVVLEADEIMEAPNWTPDGNELVFNAGGELWRLAADSSSTPIRIETGSLRDINNDHLLSPDGTIVYFSENNGHLYAVPIGGGEPRKISNDHSEKYKYYLHGISPDGKTLTYVAEEYAVGIKRLNLFSIPAAGGGDHRLSDVDYPNDGPEYSPDGQWIYFSSERAARIPGHAQCFRMRVDGTGIEQLTFDDRVNWFPHVSPDGRSVVYISYPPGTTGHPANKDVVLCLMNPDGGAPREVAAFLGGQGTINVNSWAPDSQHFAYVAYPMQNSTR